MTPFGIVGKFQLVPLGCAHLALLRDDGLVLHAYVLFYTQRVVARCRYVRHHEHTVVTARQIAGIAVHGKSQAVAATGREVVIRVALLGQHKGLRGFCRSDVAVLGVVQRQIPVVGQGAHTILSVHPRTFQHPGIGCDLGFVICRCGDRTCRSVHPQHVIAGQGETDVIALCGLLLEAEITVIGRCRLLKGVVVLSGYGIAQIGDPAAQAPKLVARNAVDGVRCVGILGQTMLAFIIGRGCHRTGFILDMQIVAGFAFQEIAVGAVCDHGPQIGILLGGDEVGCLHIVVVLVSFIRRAGMGCMAAGHILHVLARGREVDVPIRVGCERRQLRSVPILCQAQDGVRVAVFIGWAVRGLQGQCAILQDVQVFCRIAVYFVAVGRQSQIGEAGEGEDGRRTGVSGSFESVTGSVGFQVDGPV